MHKTIASEKGEAQPGVIKSTKTLTIYPRIEESDRQQKNCEKGKKEQQFFTEGG